MKRQVAILFMLVMLVSVVTAGYDVRTVEAASASVQFTTDAQEVKTGDEFNIICSVSSAEKFNDVEMNLLYDAQLFEFIKGGKKVSGGNGVLHIASTGNTESVKKRTYSLQFRALKQGAGNFDLDDQISVTNASGEKLSISANLLTISVADAAGNTGDVQTPENGGVMGSAAPTSTPEVVLSRNNKLKVLAFNCLSMSPQFDPEVKEYTVNVDCNTDVLYFYYAPANSRARVRIRDNEELLTGENQVKVVVTAESGDKRTYQIKVLKESEDETRIREQKEKGTSDITFSVYEKNGVIYIQNQYQFEVANVEDEDIIPSGYVKTSVELEGKSVPAYTMQNDLDNNYLLMYLKGASGKPVLYQYDRQEKTLQRYTGTMTQKVNQGGNVAEQVKVIPNAWLYAVIVALMVVVIALLIVILNMVLKRKIGKGKKELDDLDF